MSADTSQRATAQHKATAPADQVTIHRSRQADNFTNIPNALIRDTNLSHGARGCLIEILSNIATWHVTAKGMWLKASKTGQIKGEGRNVYFKWFQEMESAGYLTRHRVPFRGDNGRTQYKTVLHFYDAPVPAEERTTLKADAELPSTGFREPEVREPVDREPVDREPVDREPVDRESIRRTNPKKTNTKNDQDEESSSPNGDRDDEPLRLVDLSAKEPKAPLAGAEVASHQSSTSRPGSTARSSSAQPPREDRGPAEKAIARINDVLDNYDAAALRLTPKMAIRTVSDLLTRFSGDVLADAVEWRLDHWDYQGHVWVNDASRNKAAVLLSRLGDLAEEWMEFKAEQQVQSWAEYCLLHQADREAALAAQAQLEAEREEQEAARAQYEAGRKVREAQWAERDAQANADAEQRAARREQERLEREAREAAEAADSARLAEVFEVEKAHRRAHPDHYAGCGDCHNCGSDLAYRCHFKTHRADVACDHSLGDDVEMVASGYYISIKVGGVSKLIHD